jgi:hypothetical protein
VFLKFGPGVSASHYLAIVLGILERVMSEFVALSHGSFLHRFELDVEGRVDGLKDSLIVLGVATKLNVQHVRELYAFFSDLMNFKSVVCLPYRVRYVPGFKCDDRE